MGCGRKWAAEKEEEERLEIEAKKIRDSLKFLLTENDYRLVKMKEYLIQDIRTLEAQALTKHAFTALDDLRLAIEGIFNSEKGNA